jgi:uncharacterized lipoprotein NlpE involved in copper resistance
MERNTLRTHAATLAFALLACACSRQAEAPQAAAPATPPVPATVPVAAVEDATGTTMAQPGVQPVAAADTRTLAGTYSGTLPCADCPGIDETLVLSADGSFVLTDTYRERPGSANVVQGSWTLESGGTRVRLDPGSKDAVDKSYEIDGDGLRILDGDGKRIGNGLPDRLQRDAS